MSNLISKYISYLIYFTYFCKRYSKIINMNNDINRLKIVLVEKTSSKMVCRTTTECPGTISKWYMNSITES